MNSKTVPGTITLFLAAVLPACANYSEQLSRAEQHYQNARYEAALASLEDLEIHRPALSKGERVRYDLTRGMTHLRLDQRADARYWLALAREEAAYAPGVLTEETRTTVERAIAELDPLAPRTATVNTTTGANTPTNAGPGQQGP